MVAILALAVHVGTSDVDLFWREWARGESPEKLQAAYYQKASPRWKEFLDLAGHPQYFVGALKLYPKFYASIQGATRRAAAQAPAIEEALEDLSRRYGAPPPPLTIGIGRAAMGGIGRPRGAYVPAEFYTKDNASDTSELSPWQATGLVPPEGIVAAAVHEAVHTYQVESSEPSLLVTCLREGAADFIAQMITGQHTQPTRVAWCNQRRKQLFREFSRGPRTGWIYDADSPRPAGRPSDIGYWIGYEIVRDFYSRARDKQTALADVVEMRDPRTLVMKSRYSYLVRPSKPARRNRITAASVGVGAAAAVAAHPAAAVAVAVAATRTAGSPAALEPGPSPQPPADGASRSPRPK